MGKICIDTLFVYTKLGLLEIMIHGIKLSSSCACVCACVSFLSSVNKQTPQEEMRRFHAPVI